MTHRRQRLLQYGSFFVLLLAITPNVTFVGHWPVAASDTHEHPETHASAPDEGGEHAAHCHTGPSQCGGGESLTGSIWAGEDAGLLPPAATLTGPRAAERIPEHETPARAIFEPPRTA